MTILLIEDDISKEENIKTVINTIPNTDLKIRHSIMSGIASLRNKAFDLVLLDMSLPLLDNVNSSHGLENGDYNPFGGKDILDEIDRLTLKCKVIIITAYEVLGDDNNRIDLQTLNRQLKNDYSGIVIDSIFYNISSIDWKNKLVNLIKQEMRELEK